MDEDRFAKGFRRVACHLGLTVPKEAAADVPMISNTSGEPGNAAVVRHE
jgi:hypothetical protein